MSKINVQIFCLLYCSLQVVLTLNETTNTLSCESIIIKYFLFYLYVKEFKFEFNENYFVHLLFICIKNEISCIRFTKKNLHYFSYSVDCRVRHLSETPEVGKLIRRQERMFRFLLLSFSSRRGVQALVKPIFRDFYFFPDESDLMKDLPSTRREIYQSSRILIDVGSLSPLFTRTIVDNFPVSANVTFMKGDRDTRVSSL